MRSISKIKHGWFLFLHVFFALLHLAKMLRTVPFLERFGDNGADTGGQINGLVGLKAYSPGGAGG